MSAVLQQRCQDYLANRRATYHQRMRRFGVVTCVLKELGLSLGDVVFDLGAGHCQFDRYLRCEESWSGVYVPVDGAIDGTDLQTWEPKVQPDFFVLQETLEHLEQPFALLDRLAPRKGLVLTTPNCEVVDVRACDPDHRSVVHPQRLTWRGFTLERWGFFGKANDTLVAWRTGGVSHV